MIGDTNQLISDQFRQPWTNFTSKSQRVTNSGNVNVQQQ